MTTVFGRRIRHIAAAAFACFLTGFGSQSASAYRVVSIGTFDKPIDARAIASQPRDVFVVEQPGRIMVLRDEIKKSLPFLDITGLVQFGGEQGLLSMAFAPDYNVSRLFYVLFVNNSGNVEIDEFRRSPTSPLLAEAGSRRKVLEIPHPGAGNHNGGQLHFGADGYLYAAIGDGGNTANPGEPARRLDGLLGKILRIDPRQNGASAYRLPPDNPYVGIAGRDEIYAYGLRNPYRFSLTDRLMTIGDVGQDRFEEVNILPITAAKGVNFGWPQYEGKVIYNAGKPGPDAPTFPIHVYSHSATGGCAVIGGYIVRDPQLPNLAGRYLYSDFCIGVLRSFIPNVAAQTVSNDASLSLRIQGITSFAQGLGGQIYVMDATRLYRLEP